MGVEAQVMEEKDVIAKVEVVAEVEAAVKGIKKVEVSMVAGAVMEIETQIDQKKEEIASIAAIIHQAAIIIQEGIRDRSPNCDKTY